MKSHIKQFRELDVILTPTTKSALASVHPIQGSRARTSRFLMWIFSVLCGLGLTSVSANDLWQWQTKRGTGLPWVEIGRSAQLNIPALEKHLANKRPAITLPLPDGTLRRFLLTDNHVLPPALAARFPEIRTFDLHDPKQPATTGRLDWTPQGLHAKIVIDGEIIYIDPIDQGLVSTYRRRDCIKTADAPVLRCDCSHDAEPAANKASPLPTEKSATGTGATRYTFRLAVATSGEYTQFHGGTVSLGLAAVVTGINRLNMVYERDIAVRFQLVPNNDQLIFTNPATDPYTAHNGPENQATIDSIIGSSNYDIGHLLHNQTGGAAALGVICLAGFKADGYSGSDVPRNDPFWIDYVAHEIGHQFGANHTFNSTAGQCAGNRTFSTAVEPGSASTIMGYANLCAADDIQSFSDPYFHATSIRQMNAIINNIGGCATTNPTGNQPPVVSAGPDFVIPIGTSFTLTANGSDADGDSLDYTWEQMDTGPSRPLGSADNGQGPLFRSFSPSPSPSRTFPRLSTLLANTVDPAEQLPTQSRLMAFRVTARDNKLGGGGTSCDDMTVQVIGVAGPFVLTAPNGAATLSGPQTVTWTPANTPNSPILANLVDIHLSLDGGQSFTYPLAIGVPNDGSENVLLPNVSNSTARVRVRASDNIFFDVSNSDFTIQPGGGPVFNHGSIAVLDTLANGNGNGMIDPGESPVLLYIPLQNTGNENASNVTATLQSSHPDVTISLASSAYATIPVNGVASQATPYVLNIAAGFPCGQALPLQLAIREDGQPSGIVVLDLPTGITQTRQTFTFTGNVAIPDNQPAGIDIFIPVSGVATPISDLDVVIGGTACSAFQGASGNGINHTYIQDLVITLIAPDGTPVILFSQPSANGPNLCNVVLDGDDGSASIDSITNNNGPHTGTYAPHQSLSAFNGKSANGTWTINISDRFDADTGDVRSMSLQILPSSTCQPADGDTDSDSDGMPDAWEMQYFGHPTSTLPGTDGDSDGHTHLEEFLAGTDPTVQSDVLRIYRDPSRGNIWQWPSTQLRKYSLQASPDGIAPWVDLQTEISGTGSLMDFVWPASPTQRYYRVEALMYP